MCQRYHNIVCEFFPLTHFYKSEILRYPLSICAHYLLLVTWCGSKKHNNFSPWQGKHISWHIEMHFLEWVCGVCLCVYVLPHFLHAYFCPCGHPGVSDIWLPLELLATSRTLLGLLVCYTVSHVVLDVVLRQMQYRIWSRHGSLLHNDCSHAIQIGLHRKALSGKIRMWISCRCHRHACGTLGSTRTWILWNKHHMNTCARGERHLWDVSDTSQNMF